MNSIVSNASDLIRSIRESKPLVHHITNYVTVNDCANITLAVGASPIMSDAMEEAREIAAISGALVLNIGTPNERTINSMLAAGKKANELNIPVALDPVGAGASGFRNETVSKLIEQIHFSVIRGNLSEIRYVAGLGGTTKGVDASEMDMSGDIQSGIDTAKILADKLGCVIAITGAADIISDGKHTVLIENGHEMLGAVTGTGCMCTSLIGSSYAVTSDYFLAAVSGVLYMGIAGEIAFEKVGQKGTGSFRVSIIDEISKLDADTVRRRARIYEV